MVGLFGKKKPAEEKDKSQGTTPAAVSPTSSVAESNDMFGGMAVGAKTRRKRGATTVEATAPPSECHSESSAAPLPAEAQKPQPLPTEQATETPQPFFAKFSVTDSGTLDEQEDPEEAQLRRRLERFYEEYNPSKLAQIDQTIKQFKGKDADLFEALVKKYGPEPIELKNEAVKKSVAAAPQVEEASTGGGAFQWGGETAGAEVAATAGWSAEPVDGQWGAGGESGFSFGDGQGTGGFQFAATVPDSDDAPSNGFGFVASGDDGAGFAFSSDPAPSASTGFAFHSSETVEGCQQGFTAEDEAQNAATSDSDDEPTLNERHRAELRDHEGSALEAKQHLAEAIKGVADAVAQRQQLVAKYVRVERDIDACIAREAFERAEELNNELIEIGEQIGAIDQVESKNEAAIPELVSQFTQSLMDLSSMYTRHRQELLDSKGEEERRVNKYVTETSSRLDTQSEKIAASLDRANRTLHNTEQEVMNIEQRHQKIQEKIGDQTKGLRDQLSVTTKEKEVLDGEIRELEAKLQLKRRQSAEKKLHISELEDKLKIIMDDFTDTVTEVSKQLEDELAKRKDAQAIVDDFSQQEEVLIREQSRFQEDRDAMLLALDQNNHKIEHYSIIASELTNAVPSEVAAYVTSVVHEVLRARAPGKTFLAQNPAATSSDATAAAGSPLAALKQLESKLRQLEQELQENQAKEASLTLRLQDIRKNIPLLEAAKKAAAQAKQFKEAQAKTLEIKTLGDECVICETGASEAASNIERLKEDIACTELSIEKERKKASASVATFARQYVGTLKQSNASREGAKPNFLRLEADVLVDCDDDLSEACSALHQALFAEAAALQFDPATPIVEDEPSEADSPQRERKVEENVEQNVPEEEAPLSPEETRELIETLEQELASAMEDENFELCDEIQSKLDKLQGEAVE